jgi:hypothetical protein
MSAAEESIQLEAVPAKRPAYDRNNLARIDQEARKHDDPWEGIDYDEIIATTQDDVEAGRFTFNSADYPTDEEAMTALWHYLESIAEEVERESTSAPPVHSAIP